jgi:hypothetical protein
VVNQNQVLLGWSCGGIALAGFVIQYLLDRRRIARQRLRDALYFQHSATALKHFYDQRRWWLWGRRDYRRAG